uniref:Uncharacterized protein n=1 Tax=Cyanistes caeruleus TaxID=156563 RepID=A0A8C0V0R6_CYACU
MPGNALLRGFRVSYKRHVLTMDDLQTLYGPNWLNDQVRLHFGNFGNFGNFSGIFQNFLGFPAPTGSTTSFGVPQVNFGPQVMNMYGDLVMDAVPDKVTRG